MHGFAVWIGWDALLQIYMHTRMDGWMDRWSTDVKTIILKEFTVLGKLDNDNVYETYKTSEVV